jgi:transposase
VGLASTGKRRLIAFIRGVADHLPQARVTFDKFHVVAHASAALDQTRRLEQRRDSSLKGLRWTLLKDRQRLSAEARADLDALISHAATKRTARASIAKARAPSSTASRSTSSTYGVTTAAG